MENLFHDDEFVQDENGNYVSPLDDNYCKYDD